MYVLEGSPFPEGSLEGWKLNYAGEWACHDDEKDQEEFWGVSLHYILSEEVGGRHTGKKNDRGVS